MFAINTIITWPFILRCSPSTLLSIVKLLILWLTSTTQHLLWRSSSLQLILLFRIISSSVIISLLWVIIVNLIFRSNSINLTFWIMRCNHSWMRLSYRRIALNKILRFFKFYFMPLFLHLLKRRSWNTKSILVSTFICIIISWFLITAIMLISPK